MFLGLLDVGLFVVETVVSLSLEDYPHTTGSS